MKLEITLPSGLRLLFEGAERADLDHTAGLLKLTDVVSGGLDAPPANPALGAGDGGRVCGR